MITQYYDAYPISWAWYMGYVKMSFLNLSYKLTVGNVMLFFDIKNGSEIAQRLLPFNPSTWLPDMTHGKEKNTQPPFHFI